MRKAAQDRLIQLIPPSSGRVVPADVWARMDQSQRISTLTGRSLDNCKDILDYPMEAAILSPNLMTGKCQVIRAILTCVTRVGLESRRLEQMQDELLQGMIDDFADDVETHRQAGRSP